MAESEHDRPRQRASTPDEHAREVAIDMAQAEADARERKADEAPAGGRFLVDGQLVDAEGNLIRK